MKLSRALAGAHVLAYRGERNTDVTGVAYDSRKVEAGDLFACVRGERADGHAFAPEAVRRGATALVVEDWVDVAVPQARVPSARRAMAMAAHEVYGAPSTHLRLVGVTGTNGKTTTTHLVEAMVGAAGLRSALVGTVGARVSGAPIAVERTTPEGPDFHRLLARMVSCGVDVAAVEVSSHALMLDRVAGAAFVTAGFTHLSHDHLDFHGDMESYFAAKARLFTPEHTKRASVMVDDPYGVRLSQMVDSSIEAWTVSVAEPAGAVDVAVRSVRFTNEGSVFSLVTPAGSVDVTLRLAGPFNVANAALAGALALQAGIPLAAVAAGAEALARVPGRFETVPNAGGVHVIVDYAHTPGGVASILAAARPLVAPGHRLVVVLGAGGDRDAAKRGPMGEAAATGADFVVITNDNPRSEDPAVIAAAVAAGVIGVGTPHVVELDRRVAIRLALSDAGPGDVVIVAGKGHESGQEVAGVVTPFDDRTVVAEELSR